MIAKTMTKIVPCIKCKNYNFEKAICSKFINFDNVTGVKNYDNIYKARNKCGLIAPQFYEDDTHNIKTQFEDINSLINANYAASFLSMCSIAPIGILTIITDFPFYVFGLFSYGIFSMCMSNIGNNVNHHQLLKDRLIAINEYEQKN